MAECSSMSGAAYKLGKSYQVQCVHWTYFGRLDWWPVLGPLHSDAKIIGFEPEHYHVDPRFLSRVQHAWLTSKRRRRSYQSKQPWYGFPLHDARLRSVSDPILVLPPPTLKRRKYLRAHGPMYWRQATWLKPLEDAYAHACMKQSVCPHQAPRFAASQ